MKEHVYGWPPVKWMLLTRRTTSELLFAVDDCRLHRFRLAPYQIPRIQVKINSITNEEPSAVFIVLGRLVVRARSSFVIS